MIPSVLPTYNRAPLTFVKGEGTWLIEADGRRFLDLGAGIAVIDRYPGGMGMARALDEGALAEVLTWARTLLYECSCMEGCRKCTPSQVLRVGTDKQAVLAMLEGI